MKHEILRAYDPSECLYISMRVEPTPGPYGGLTSARVCGVDLRASVSDTERTLGLLDQHDANNTAEIMAAIGSAVALVSQIHEAQQNQRDGDIAIEVSRQEREGYRINMDDIRKTAPRYTRINDEDYAAVEAAVRDLETQKMWPGLQEIIVKNPVKAAREYLAS